MLVHVVAILTSSAVAAPARGGPDADTRFGCIFPAFSCYPVPDDTRPI